MRFKIFAIFLVLSGCSVLSHPTQPSNCIGSNEDEDDWRFMAESPQNSDELISLLKLNDMQQTVSAHWLAAADGRIRFCQFFGEQRGAKLQDFELKDGVWHLGILSFTMPVCERNCRGH